MTTQDEQRRAQIISKAVDSVIGIMQEDSDKTDEEYNYLTIRVAEELLKMAICPFTRAVLLKDARLATKEA